MFYMPMANLVLGSNFWESLELLPVHNEIVHGGFKTLFRHSPEPLDLREFLIAMSRGWG